MQPFARKLTYGWDRKRRHLHGSCDTDRLGSGICTEGETKHSILQQRLTHHDGIQLVVRRGPLSNATGTTTA